MKDYEEIRETVSKIHDNEHVTDRTISNLTFRSSLVGEQINNITIYK